MNIEKKLISKNYSKGVTITPKYIVIHETANTKAGANADAHYNYWNTSNSAKASAHFVVDDKKIIQLLPLDVKAWHVGDNKGYSDITNNNSIGIEICVNSDGNYDIAFQNAVALTKQLMTELNIPIDRVVRHFDASGKNCPESMSGNNWALWNTFKAQLIASTELTSVNDIVWELAHRGIVSDKGLWLEKLAADSNAYWLARKTVKYLKEKNI